MEAPKWPKHSVSTNIPYISWIFLYSREAAHHTIIVVSLVFPAQFIGLRINFAWIWIGKHPIAAALYQGDLVYTSVIKLCCNWGQMTHSVSFFLPYEESLVI